MRATSPETGRARTSRESVILMLLAAIYLMSSIRYFPGRAMRSLVETLSHILAVAPISLGFTLLLVAVLQRLMGERLPFDRAARIFLVAGICLEFVLGLAHYFTTSAPA